MKFRKLIFWGHLISGLIIGSILMVMAVTGISMSFKSQIVDFSERNVRYIKKAAYGERLSLKKLAAGLLEKYPAMSLAGITLKRNHFSSVAVNLGKEGGIFYLNPYTGDVLGRGSKINEFMLAAENLHRRLALGENGRKVTGACALALLVMVLSGLYLWWPQQWTASVLKSIMFFKGNVQGKVRDWNWHNVFGFWCSLLLLTSAVTGVMMSYSWAGNLLYRITGTEIPASAPSKGGMVKPAGKPATEEKIEAEVNFDLMLPAIQEAAPSWETINFRIPREAGAPVMAMIEEKNSFPKFVRSMATLESSTGKMMKWEPASKVNAGRKAQIWNHYIHTGEAGGVLGQLFAFFSGLGAVMLIWTGFSLSWYRFFKDKKIKI